MGSDPQESVAEPYGELHDTPGVWIGDASAFPTPSGTNPMITIMALAQRTGEAILAAVPGHHRRGRDRIRRLRSSASPPTRSFGTVSSSGRVVEPAGSGTIDINPTTEEVIGRVPEGSPEDADRAVRAARAAFETWSQTSPYERALAGAIGAKLAERGDELGVLIATELGMPLTLSRMIQAGCRRHLLVPDRARRGDRLGGGSGQLADRARARGRGRRDHPWNYPLSQIANKVAPALTAGCTVVLKPSEVVPLCTFVLAEICDEVGLPAGVFNLVTGYGPVVGEAIVSHPETDMVSFTGSTRAGRRVSELAAQAVKPASLELGGKSPNIILDDADLEQAVTDGVAKCYLNSGQTCSALTRMLVPRDKLEQVESIAAVVAESFTPGDPFTEGTMLGPLVSTPSASACAATSRRGGPREPSS